MATTVDQRVRFEAAFTDCYERVWRYAQRRADNHTAEDVAAEVFVVAWRRIEDMPNEPLPWLLAVARHIIANNRRSVDRQIRLQAKMEQQVSTQQTTDEEDLYEFKEWLHWALDRLKPIDRELLTLIAWDNLSHKEAAAVLGCLPSTFAMRLRRAQKRLLSELSADPELKTDLHRSEARS